MVSSNIPATLGGVPQVALSAYVLPAIEEKRKNAGKEIRHSKFKDIATTI